MRSLSSPRAVSMRIGDVARIRLGAQAPAQLDARHAGQHPVEHDEVGALLLEEDERFLAGLGMRDAEALGLEIVAQHLGERRFVLDDENLSGHSDCPASSHQLPEISVELV